jgi:hypothetical protein
MLAHMFASSLILVLISAGPSAKEVGRLVGCSGGTQRCVVSSEKKAGEDADHVALKVVQVSRGEKKNPEDEEVRGECSPDERWLVRGTTPPEARLLLKLCNDGYGAAGVGEDVIKVAPNRLSHEQSGGSAWRWISSREFQLSPPKLLSVTSTSFHATTSQLTDETRWSWETFSGERTRAISLCQDDGTPDQREEAEPKTVKSAMVPKLKLPTEFVDGGWKDTALGGCAARASYFTYGGKGTDEDASLKVVAASDTELYLEVTDDVFTANETKWIAGDHLELWLSEEDRSSSEDCVGRHGPEAFQWAIDLPSGAMRAGQGARVGLPKVELAQKGTLVRVKLTLPLGVWKAITVVYSDSDDGKKQKRLIATSQFAFPQAATLGRLSTINEKFATCVVENGTLTPKSTWVAPASGPLFPSSAAQ